MKVSKFGDEKEESEKRVIILVMQEKKLNEFPTGTRSRRGMLIPSPVFALVLDTRRKRGMFATDG